MRGRNRSKGPNPLTRSYESNGPDVKIRGTAQHVADKYAQLARDAHASGDPVSAENYYQHAEHYYRLIAAAQEQFRQQYGTTFPRPFGEDGDEDGDEEGGGPGFGQGGDRNGAPYGEEVPEGYGAPQNQGYEPRGGERQGYEPRGNQDRQGQQRFDRNNNRNNNGQRFDRPGGGERYDRGPNGYDRQSGDRQGGERHQAGDRHGGAGGERVNGPRNDRPDHRGDRFPRNEYGARDGGQREAQPELRTERPDRQDRPDRQNRYDRDGNRPHQPRPAESRYGSSQEDAPADNLPAFLTNPVMRPPLASGPEFDVVAPSLPGVGESEGGSPADEAGARPARRRRTRKPIEAADDMGAAAAPEDAA